MAQEDYSGMIVRFPNVVKYMDNRASLTPTKGSGVLLVVGVSVLIAAKLVGGL